ncbi:MAG: hypothetical protein GC204_05295 [Chloroflexi bacterium]|nr:hypothetical protein [Chloroflexota bacterium]
MKRFLALCFFFLLPLQPLTAQAADSTRDADWREDAAFLWQQIQTIHPDPFRVTTQTAFEQMVSDLNAEIPTLSDAQIVVRLFEIIAALRDGHSWLGFQQTDYPMRYYPLYFYPFSDGLYLVQAAPDDADWVGARLIRIGTTDIMQVRQMLEPLAPRDNDFSGLVTLPMRLSNVDMLLGTGIITDADHAGYVLERTDGEQITLNPTPELFAQFSQPIPLQWRLPQAEKPLALSRVDEAFWWTYLDGDQVIYVQYNQVVSRSTSAPQTLSALRTELESALASGTIRRVILDLRYNAGGDINTARPLRSFFSGSDFFSVPGNLIVLTGRNTFSAGVVFSLWLEHEAAPIFMGESTGGRPPMFENAREITLPHSKLHGQIATQARHDYPGDDTRATIAPQVSVLLSSADYFNQLDPVLVAALAYTES